MILQKTGVISLNKDNSIIVGDLEIDYSDAITTLMDKYNVSVEIAKACVDTLLGFMDNPRINYGHIVITPHTVDVNLINPNMIQFDTLAEHLEPTQQTYSKEQVLDVFRSWLKELNDDIQMYAEQTQQELIEQTNSYVIEYHIHGTTCYGVIKMPTELVYNTAEKALRDTGIWQRISNERTRRLAKQALWNSSSFLLMPSESWGFTVTPDKQTTIFLNKDMLKNKHFDPYDNYLFISGNNVDYSITREDMEKAFARYSELLNSMVQHAMDGAQLVLRENIRLRNHTQDNGRDYTR